MLVALVVIAGCAHAPRTPPQPWPLPDGWKREVIAFPLDFAPTLAHRGFEELRFAPGMFDPKAGGYWSYAFAWRLDDPAKLDGDALAAELTAYFRGLVAAVKKELPVDAIVVRATPARDGFELAAHVLDAFGSGAPVELAGTAQRRACGGGALWVITFAPATTTVGDQLRALADAARCDTVRR